WNPADDPKVIHTFNGGRHWESISQESLQIIQFFDGQHGYGAEVTKFLRTVDGGRTWTETQIPRIRAIDRMLFLSRDVGWIAGTDGTNLFVFRTTDGGRSWRESRPRVLKGLPTCKISSSSTRRADGSSRGITTTAERTYFPPSTA